MNLSDLNNASLVCGILTDEAIVYLKLKNNVVILPEHRPFSFSLKKNRNLLEANSIKYIFCTDNMIGLLFYQQKIKEIIFMYSNRSEKHYMALSGSFYFLLLGFLHKCVIKKFLSKQVYNQDNESVLNINREEIIKNINKSTYCLGYDLEKIPLEYVFKTYDSFG